MRLTVGAITEKRDSGLPGAFSNYGKKEVNIFAPGEKIYSTIPQNKYEMLFGTGMAVPMVTGVAALLLEYYPQLTAFEVRKIILKSATSLKGKIVLKPVSDEMIDFGKLCSSGRVLNGYNALKMAEKLTVKRNK